MRPIFAIFNFLRGLKTTKFHEVPAGTATKMYGEDSNGDLVKDDVPSGGAAAFTDLSDVPESYTDQAGKMLVVNENENGLEYIDLGTVITDSHAHANKDDLDNYDPDNFAASNHNHNLNDLTEKSYNSLTDKPTIPSGELEYFDENRNNSTPNATVPAHQIIPKGEETNIDFVLSPKGTGAIIAHIPNSSTSGGNKRGQYSVDLQVNRSNADQVAGAQYSMLLGGRRNKITSAHLYSFIIGGFQNELKCPSSTSNYNTIIGGDNNVIRAYSEYSSVIGSSNSKIQGYDDNFYIDNNGAVRSIILGGSYNTIRGSIMSSKSNNSIVGGYKNEMKASDYSAIISGYESEIINAKNVICSGRQAKGIYYGQQAHASGRFAATGDAQRSNYVLRGNVLTTNYYRLYLDNASKLIDLSQAGAYSTWQCKLMVSGLRRLTGAIDHYVSEHNFMIYRENSTPVIADFTEIHVHQVAASSVATGVSISTNSLAIDIATTENNWQFVAHLETVETYSDSLV